jgi:hypothetical protein
MKFAWESSSVNTPNLSAPLTLNNAKAPTIALSMKPTMEKNGKKLPTQPKTVERLNFCLNPARPHDAPLGNSFEDGEQARRDQDESHPPFHITAHNDSGD